MSLSAAEMSLAPAEKPKAEACPKCAKPLANSAGLGWCSACGYCRSLEGETKTLAAPTQTEDGKTPPGGRIEETSKAVANLPLWFWVTLIVVADAVAISIVAGRQLPEGSNFQRALWCTLQIGFGVLLLLLSQWWVLLQIGPDEPTLSFRDAFVPGRLWGLAFKRLPKNQVALWLAAFGLTLAVTAGVCIGGVGHWLSYLPNAKPADAPATKGPSTSTTFVMPQ